MGKKRRQISGCPLAILPEKTWAAVFERVTDPSDILNCYYIHYCWKKILSTGNFHFRLVSPFLLKYLPQTDILNARLVSKLWKGTIDHYLETGQFAQYFNNITRAFTGMKFVEVALNNKNLGKFCSDMERSTSNPIVSRYVFLSLRCNLPEIFSFLKLFGIHIWHLSLYIPTKEFSAAGLTNVINNLLQLVPNLRLLRISFFVQFQLKSSVNKEEVDPNIIATTFPALAHLKTVYIQYELVPFAGMARDHHLLTHVDKPSLLCLQLFDTYGPQLNHLFYNFATPYHQQLKNLTHLDLHITSICVLDNLQNLECPLKVLEMFISILEGFPVSSIFRVAGRFQETLEVLSFFIENKTSCSKKAIWPNWETEEINLPKLRHLMCANVYGKEVSFDFLEKLPSLTRVDIIRCWYDVSKKKERVEIRKHLFIHSYATPCEKGIYQSNIWEVLPRLEKLVIWGKDYFCHPTEWKPACFSRGRYEYLRQKVEKPKAVTFKA